MKIAVMQLGAYRTNCYLVWDETTKNAVAIDPGDQPSNVLQFLKQNGLSLQMILLTHAHFDHMGAVAALREETGCRVFAHRLEQTLPANLRSGPLEPTDFYDEGDTVTLDGLTFQVLHTPGHTPGSVCLLAGDVLFSGDTLFAGSCGRTDFEGGSWTQMIQSLKRLSLLEGDYTVLPGHEGSTSLNHERDYNPYLAEAAGR